MHMYIICTCDTLLTAKKCKLTDTADDKSSTQPGEQVDGSYDVRRERSDEATTQPSDSYAMEQVSCANSAAVEESAASAAGTIVDDVTSAAVANATNTSCVRVDVDDKHISTDATNAVTSTDVVDTEQNDNLARGAQSLECDHKTSTIVINFVESEADAVTRDHCSVTSADDATASASSASDEDDDSFRREAEG